MIQIENKRIVNKRIVKDPPHERLENILKLYNRLELDNNVGKCVISIATIWEIALRLNLSIHSIL